MSMTVGLVIHITGGTVGLASGAVALFTKKGGSYHLSAGNVYVASMAIMAATGFYLAAEVMFLVTMLAASLSLYLVCSSWLTVRRSKAWRRQLEWMSFTGGVAVLVLGLFSSWRAYSGVTDRLADYAIPAFIYYLFTSIALIGVLTDLRVLAGAQLGGRHRLMRHLWRMLFPLYVAASSFFTGQQQVFPEFLRGSIFLTLPEVSVILLLLFWLARTWLIDGSFGSPKLARLSRARRS